MGNVISRLRNLLAFRPERILIWCFLTYFIAFLAIITFGISEWSFKALSHQTEISWVHSAGRQSYLSFKVGQQLLHYNRDQGTPQAQIDKFNAESALLSLKTENNIFTNPGFTVNYRSRDALSTALKLVNREYKGLRNLAINILAEKDRTKANAMFLQYAKACDVYTSDLNNSVNQFVMKGEQNNQQQLVATLKAASTFLSIFLLLTFVILWPVLRAVRRSVEKTRELQELADCHRAELTIQNEKLIESQSQLSAQNEELTSQRSALEANRRELFASSEDLKFLSSAALVSAQRFEELFQSIPAACIGFDKDGTIYDWNRKSDETFEVKAYEAITHPIWDFIVPRSEKRYAKKLVKEVFKGKIFKDLDIAFQRPSGETRHLLLSVFPIYGANGLVNSAVAACIDVTEHREAELQIKRSEETIRTVLESLHEGLVMQNRNGEIVLTNENAAQVLGLTPEQMIGRSAEGSGCKATKENGEDLLYEEFPATVALSTGKPVIDVTMAIRTPDNEQRWLSINAIPVFESDSDEPQSVVVSFTNITERIHQQKQLKEQMVTISEKNEELGLRQAELERAYQQLETLAITDGLTGLLNHRTFQDRLKNEISYSGRRHISLILMDVDHFKQYNDEFGHPAGDQVLKKVAEILQKVCPETTHVARYGGEEFTVIAPRTDHDDAMKLAEEVRAAIEAGPWTLRPVSVSIGVSTATSIDCPAQLILAADRALYQSKHGGRNQVTFGEISKVAA